MLALIVVCRSQASRLHAYGFDCGISSSRTVSQVAPPHVEAARFPPGSAGQFAHQKLSSGPAAMQDELTSVMLLEPEVLPVWTVFPCESGFEAPPPASANSK